MGIKELAWISFSVGERNLREVANLSHSVDSRLTSCTFARGLNPSRISWGVLVLPVTPDPPSVVVDGMFSPTLHSYDPETATVCTQMTLTWTS